jgi:hypothetical protein
MPAYTTLRLKKLKSAGSLRLALEHNTRDRPPLHADPERASSNYVSRSTDKSIELYKKLLPDKVRKNAVHAVEFVVQASPGTPPTVLISYFNASFFWLIARLGGDTNLLNYAIHYDEESPHFHLIMMPLRDGRLNYNSYLGGNKFQLRQLQTDFAKEVGTRHGLERGIERSGIEHRGHNTYRQQMAAPLTNLPTVTLPEPSLGQGKRAYGEQVAKLYDEAYAPLLERLTATTNKAKILEDEKRQVMRVSSARAKENDGLREELTTIKMMILENDPRLAQYRAQLLKEAAEREKQTGKKKPRDRSDDRGR